jgi:hypothetical protein
MDISLYLSASLPFLCHLAGRRFALSRFAHFALIAAYAFGAITQGQIDGYSEAKPPVGQDNGDHGSIGKGGDGEHNQDHCLIMSRSSLAAGVLGDCCRFPIIGA